MYSILDWSLGCGCFLEELWYLCFLCCHRRALGDVSVVSSLLRISPPSGLPYTAGAPAVTGSAQPVCSPLPLSFVTSQFSAWPPLIAIPSVVVSLYPRLDDRCNLLCILPEGIKVVLLVRQLLAVGGRRGRVPACNLHRSLRHAIHSARAFCLTSLVGFLTASAILKCQSHYSRYRYPTESFCQKQFSRNTFHQHP